ncbi:MAG: 1,4-dihydroxy-2-naphthoate polyprenyltransferase, partial [Acidimicrobiales bacterium]
KRTLAVRIGRRAGGWLYVLCVSAPFVGALVWLAVSLSAPPATGFRGAMVLPLVALPLAVPLVRTVLGESDGRALLPVLAGTGRLELAFGSLLAVALLWWLW